MLEKRELAVDAHQQFSLSKHHAISAEQEVCSQAGASLALPFMGREARGAMQARNWRAAQRSTSATTQATCLVQSPAMTNLTSAVKQLQQERNRLASRLEQLSEAISVLTAASSGRRARTISATGRARNAAAQRARWAKARGKVVSIASRKRRKLSAAALAHIRAAQKARWAKWRKQHKSA